MTDTLIVWLCKRCKEESFQQFLGAVSEQDAINKAKQKCCIRSRKELLTDPAAKNRFDESIRIPFIKFQGNSNAHHHY